MNARTKVSPNGDVTIPKDVRDRLAWKPGTPLEVVETPGGISLRKPVETPFAPRTLDDLDALAGGNPAQPVEAISGLSDEDIRRLTQ